MAHFCVRGAGLPPLKYGGNIPIFWKDNVDKNIAKFVEAEIVQIVRELNYAKLVHVCLLVYLMREREREISIE